MYLILLLHWASCSESESMLCSRHKIPGFILGLWA